MMAWVYLLIASLGEVFGVISIHLYLEKKSLGRLIQTIVIFSIGFLFLSLAMRDSALGTAYAVWTGLGAVGAVLIGILFFNEPANWRRIFFIIFIITGTIGLKIVE
jgi:paired small multidrug resistance pump